MAQGRISVILAAGGRGTRFAHTGRDTTSLPKQYIDLGGYPIFVWSLECLMRCESVRDAVIVAPPDVVTETERQIDLLAEKFAGKEIRVVPGGASRQESVYLGLCALESNAPDFVMIHDAARPFLTPEIVNRVRDSVMAGGACTVAIPASDTIKKVSDGIVSETLSRESLYLVQTPQAGKFSWLIDAHRKALLEGSVVTDDAAILEMNGHRVSIVDGATYNIKITQPDDMILAKALLHIVLHDRL